MSITIDLAPDEEQRLREKAARQGQNAADYAAAVLRHDVTDTLHAVQNEQETLAVRLMARVGRLRSAEPSNMAANSEAEFAHIMDEKQAQGHV